MKIMINKTKAILASFVVVFMGGFGIFYFVHSMYPEGPVFLGIAVLFAYLFYKNASSVTISEEGVCRAFFGLFPKRMSWSEIKEMGLIGENVFNRKKEKNGDKYIYFSPREMTKEERFDMIVKWPPKDMLYLQYGEKQLSYAMTIWGKDLKTYNVQDLFPDTENPKSEAVTEQEQNL